MSAWRESSSSIPSSDRLFGVATRWDQTAPKCGRVAPYYSAEAPHVISTSCNDRRNAVPDARGGAERACGSSWAVLLVLEVRGGLEPEPLATPRLASGRRRPGLAKGEPGLDGKPAGASTRGSESRKPAGACTRGKKGRPRRRSNGSADPPLRFAERCRTLAGAACCCWPCCWRQLAERSDRPRQAAQHRQRR
jgi:hypothetical protein